MNLLIFYIIFYFLLDSHAQTINKLYMIQSNSILNTSRDGFLVATLVTGENTTICNYRFTDADANVACLTLGYPAKGLSIVNPNSNITGPVLIGDINCRGTETNLNLCISSGRKVFGGQCSSHNMDAYVYCLQDKVAPQIIPTTVTTTCNSTNGAYGFIPVPNKINTGFLTFSGSYVCNDNYGITGADVPFLCQKFCNVVTNPFLSMPNSGAPTNAKYVYMTAPTYVGTSTNCTSNKLTVALQCGLEPAVIELSPNITCTSQNITATWIKGFVPAINPSVVSLATSCSNTSYKITSDNFNDVIVNINFTCPYISTSTATSISYSYILTRSYLSDGVISISARNLTISCVFPKSDSSNQNISLNNPTAVYLNATSVIPVQMVFYTDITYLSPMPLPYSIFDNMLMYVKVSLISTLSTLRLGLVNCKIATVNSMAETNSVNSIELITNSCPSTNNIYRVAIYPLTRKDIGLVFQPYVINGISSIYVLCETTKCFMDTSDSNCLNCKTSSRRKRSAMLTEMVVQGPFVIRQQNTFDET